MLFPPFQKTAPKPKNGSEIKYQSIILDEEKLLKLENFCSSQREKKTSSHKILRSENQTSEVVFLEKNFRSSPLQRNNKKKVSTKIKY